MFVEYIFLYKYFIFCLLDVIFYLVFLFFYISSVDIEKVFIMNVDFVLLVILELNLKYDFI